MKADVKRPIASEFSHPTEFMRAMLKFRRESEPHFSIAKHTASLRRVSPALVSLILQKRRRITPDRVEELASLMALNASEKFYFKNWVHLYESGIAANSMEQIALKAPKQSRKHVSLSLFNDWINVYVKDLFQLPEIQRQPELIFKQLAHIVPRERVERSLKFLLKEGYLRRTPDGKIVVETHLAVSDTKVPSQKIRRFHKSALKVAQASIDLFSPAERLANTLTLPLSEEGYEELLQLTGEFAEKLKDFAEREGQEGDRLYQLTLNISPIGGKAK